MYDGTKCRFAQYAIKVNFGNAATTTTVAEPYTSRRWHNVVFRNVTLKLNQIIKNSY